MKEIDSKILKLKERERVVEKAKYQAWCKTVTLKYEIECKEVAYWEARTDECIYQDQLMHIRKAITELEKNRMEE